MRDKAADFVFMVLFMLIGFIAGFGAGAGLVEHRSYRQGQIDAIEGRVKYRATTQMVYEEATR